MGFIFDLQIVQLGLGLIILILVNIMLGSMSAILNREFDKEKLLRGFIKGAIITVSFISCYGVGLLNPDVMVINVNGQDVNMLTSINIIVLGGYGWYAVQVASKLAGFINAKFNESKPE